MEVINRAEEPFKIRKIHGKNKIYLDIYIAGHRFKKTTGINCEPDQFNKEDQVVRKNHPDRTHANRALRELQIRLDYIYENQDKIRYKEDIENLWNFNKPDNKGPYLLDYIQDRITEKESYSPKLGIQYRAIKKRWKEYMPQPIYIEDVRKRHLVEFKNFIQSKKVNRGGKIYEVDGWSYMNGLKAMFGKAYSDDLIQTNPFTGLKLERKEKNLPWHKPPTHQQIIKFLSHSWKTETEIKVRDYVKLMYFCQGIEPMDFFLLRVLNLSLHTKDGKSTFYWKQKRSKLKNSSKMNVYLIPSFCLDELLKYHGDKEPHEFIFETSKRPVLDENDLEYSGELKRQIADFYKRLSQRYLKPMAKSLGFDPIQWNFKNLKKAYTNYSVNILNNIEDTRALMGHESAKTTKNHYVSNQTRLDLEEKIKAYQKLKRIETENENQRNPIMKVNR